jgi:hypothetical protein
MDARSRIPDTDMPLDTPAATGDRHRVLENGRAGRGSNPGARGLGARWIFMAVSLTQAPGRTARGRFSFLDDAALRHTAWRSHP